jgi:hypothetical protein
MIKSVVPKVYITFSEKAKAHFILHDLAKLTLFCLAGSAFQNINPFIN